MFLSTPADGVYVEFSEQPLRRPDRSTQGSRTLKPVDVVARLSLLVCVVLAAGETIWFLRALNGHAEPAMVGWFAAPLTIALGTAALFQTASAAAPGAATRRFWLTLALGGCVMTASVAGQAVAALVQPGHAALPADTPPLSLAGYLIAALVPLWALLRLPGAAQTAQARLRLALDTATVALGGGLFAYWFLFGDPHKSPSGSGVWSQFAIGLVAMVALAAIAKLLLSGTGPISPGVLRIFALCLVIGGLSPAMLRITASHPQLAPPQLTDPFIAVVIVCACLKQRTTMAVGRPVSVAGRSPRRPHTFLPYLAIAATDALLLVALSRSTS